MRSCFTCSQNKSSVAQLDSASDCYTSGYQEVGSSSLPGGAEFLAMCADRAVRLCGLTTAIYFLNTRVVGNGMKEAAAEDPHECALT